MLVDIETNGRSALATLDVLSRELGCLSLPNDQARRVDALLDIARQHVTELVIPAPTVARQPHSIRDASVTDDAASTPGDLSSEANAMWVAAAALRRATSTLEVLRHRDQLEALASRTNHASVRQRCQEALSTQQQED